MPTCRPALSRSTPNPRHIAFSHDRYRPYRKLRAEQHELLRRKWERRMKRARAGRTASLTASLFEQIDCLVSQLNRVPMDTAAPSSL